jgi:hypothetical protein
MLMAILRAILRIATNEHPGLLTAVMAQVHGDCFRGSCNFSINEEALPTLELNWIRR